MVWRFSWLTSWDEVWDPANLDAWRAAFAPDANARRTPFMHPDVVRAWLRARGQENFDPFFFRATNDGGTSLCLLLVRPAPTWRDGFLRTLVPVGGVGFDYHEPVVIAGRDGLAQIGPDFWSALAAELGHHEGRWFDRVAIRHLRSDVYRRPGAIKPAESIQYLDLAPYADIEAYLASRSANMRSTIRRTEKELRALGDFSFVVHAPTDLDGVLAWIPRFAAEKTGRYPGEGGAARLERIATCLAEEALATGVLHCSSIVLDGESISWEVNFYLDGVLYLYLPTFDSRFRRGSIGLYHKVRTIEWLFQNGGRAYDFLRGDEDYKGRLTDGALYHMHQFEMASATAGSEVRVRMRRAARRLNGLLSGQGVAVRPGTSARQAN